MSKTKKRISLKDIASAVVACLLILAVIGGCIAISKIDTKTISSLSFKRGSLTESGTYQKSDTAIYTEELFECQGLTVTVDFESDVEYRVFYYREDKSFIGATENLKVDYEKDATYANAKYARIVIYPTLESGKKVGIFDVNKYARQITIKVSLDQSFDPVLTETIPGIKNQLTFESSFPIQKNNGPYCYQDMSIYEGKTVRKIGVPVKLIKDVSEDATFTVYVVTKTSSGTFTKVKELKLVIPGGTFGGKEKVSLDNIGVTGSTYNYLYNLVGDEITGYSIIDEWYYFDVDIHLENGQTLAFFDSEDDIFPAYHNGLANEEAMDMYCNIFGTLATAPSVEFYTDVLILE